MIGSIDFNHIGAQANDILTACIAVGTLLGYLWGRLKPILPKKTRDWVAKVGGEEKLTELVTQAQGLKDTTNTIQAASGQQKRDWVAAQIAKLASQNNICLTDSEINLGIEWVLARVKAVAK